MLEKAHEYLDLHTNRALKLRGEEPSELLVSEYQEQHWAAEVAGCCHGLALAHLIYGSERSGDARIEQLLLKARRPFARAVP